MNLVQVFIQRRIATTLLALGLGLSGLMAYFLLPVSPYPNIDIPTIQVTANMPGASPETMAATVATPLERHLGTIAGVTEMTSRSNVNNTSIVMYRRRSVRRARICPRRFILSRPTASSTRRTSRSSSWR
jgi:multidrug efflux pump